MQGTIIYLLTEQAQRDNSKVTGAPTPQKQETTVDVTPENIDLFSVLPDGTLRLDLTERDTPFWYALEATGKVEIRSRTPYFSTANPTIADLIREGKAVTARREREAVEERRAATLAALKNRRTKTLKAYESIDGKQENYEFRVPDWPYQPNEEVVNSPEAREWVESLLQAKEEARQAAIKQITADLAAAAEKESAKTAYIASWLSGHGPKDLQEQYAAGLLDRSVVLSMIADVVFGETVEWDPGICSDTSCPCGRKDVTTIPPDVYRKWKDVKSKLPQEPAKVEFKTVNPHPDDDLDFDSDEEQLDDVYAALVKLQVGPFLLTRLVRLT